MKNCSECKYCVGHTPPDWGEPLKPYCSLFKDWTNECDAEDCSEYLEKDYE